MSHIGRGFTLASIVSLTACGGSKANVDTGEASGAVAWEQVSPGVRLAVVVGEPLDRVVDGLVSSAALPGIFAGLGRLEQLVEDDASLGISSPAGRELAGDIFEGIASVPTALRQGSAGSWFGRLTAAGSVTYPGLRSEDDVAGALKSLYDRLRWVLNWAARDAAALPDRDAAMRLHDLVVWAGHGVAEERGAAVIDRLTPGNVTRADVNAIVAQMQDRIGRLFGVLVALGYEVPSGPTLLAPSGPRGALQGAFASDLGVAALASFAQMRLALLGDSAAKVDVAEELAWANARLLAVGSQ